ncbi:transmembrane protein 26-like [Branchiostoma lanceolatum]|uniref:transmembrane protein 26-like n=1 Tax=Branchiostoma lanceolatum TaxID=7740 RepID=UPI00345453B3
MSRNSTTSRDGKTGEMGDRNANISMGNISVHPQSASSIRSKRTLPAPPPRARPSLRRGSGPSPGRSVHCPEGWHTFRMAAADFFVKMLDVINTSFNIFKAILTRLLFSLHAIITIWRTEENTGQPLFWLFCLPLYFLLVEGVITIKKRKGLEWKWFCPSVLFYLMSVIPSLWVLEFDIMYKRFKSPEECPMFFSQTDENSTVSVTTAQTTLHTVTATHNTTASSGHGPPSLFSVFPLGDSAWVLALHQTMLCILILGRWMLPKPGDVSRDQLSQLLLVYFGIAADILEFQLESVKEDAVKCNEGLIVMVMVFWTWSLIQFTLVLTATKTGQVVEDTKLDRINLHGCCESEVWSILVAMLMQDLPFLVVRLFLMIQYNSVHQMMIFFTAKNILVLMLQTYRWYVLMAERRAERQQLVDQGRRQKEGKSARPWETRRVHNWIDDAC